MNFARSEEPHGHDLLELSCLPPGLVLDAPRYCTSKGGHPPYVKVKGGRHFVQHASNSPPVLPINYQANSLLVRPTGQTLGPWQIL